MSSENGINIPGPAMGVSRSVDRLGSQVVAMKSSRRTQENSSTVVGPLPQKVPTESEIYRIAASLIASSPGPRAVVG